MTKLEKRVNLVAVALPFVAFLAAIVLLWNSAVSATDLAILAVMYVLTGVGVTVGFHRLLTHRSFQVSKPLEYAFAILGSMAVQGPVMSWVADHRKHHAHADEEGDPHSPHVGHGDGASGVLRGLWHAHTGWLFSTQGQASPRRYAKDLYEDPGMRLINRRFPMLVLLSLAVPAFAGWALTGTLAGAAGGLLWGGLVRIFLVHHITWSVNSVCHFLGHASLPDRRPLDQRRLARAAVLRGGVAPQPPRVPALGRARAAPMGETARPRGARDHDARKGRSRPERRQDRSRAPAPAGASGGAAACRSARLTRAVCGVRRPILTCCRTVCRGHSSGDSFISARSWSPSASASRSCSLPDRQDGPAFVVYGLARCGPVRGQRPLSPRTLATRRESAAPACRSLHDLRPDRRRPTRRSAFTSWTSALGASAAWAWFGPAPWWRQRSSCGRRLRRAGWSSCSRLRSAGSLCRRCRPSLDELGWVATALIGLGGVLYTVGAVIYARRRPDPLPDVFGYHEVFHALTIAGAASPLRGHRVLGPAAGLARRRDS